MAAVTSWVNALNNVMQISFFFFWRGGGEEVNKGHGCNKLEYDLPA